MLITRASGLPSSASLICGFRALRTLLLLLPPRTVPGGFRFGLLFALSLLLFKFARYSFLAGGHTPPSAPSQRQQEQQRAYLSRAIADAFQPLVFQSAACLVHVELATSRSCTRTLYVLHHFAWRADRLLFWRRRDRCWLCRILEQALKLLTLLFECIPRMSC